MKHEFDIEKHERKYGPHFDEECAKWCVSKMENEDGTIGAHWSIEETTQVAQQYNINLKGDKFNKYDWFVSLNMIYSDFYKVVVNMLGNSSVQYFVELTKAWINDKDVPEGKTWNYFKYVVCNEQCNEEDEDKYYEEDEDEYDDEDYPFYVKHFKYRKYKPLHRDNSRYMDEYDEYYEPMYHRRKRFSKY